MKRVAVIGGGPAGLMAAEMLAPVARVQVFDAMPSVGRKFLMAGKGGMNITHSEPAERFLGRYGRRASRIAPLLAAFGPDQLRCWLHELGVETFVGSSGRVFPTDMKAAPLLRAWLHRLRQAGVGFQVRHRWLGWAPGADGSAGQVLRFASPEGDKTLTFDAVVLALGGGSWARLGSDGAWLPLLAEQGIAVTPLKPANCGFDVAGGWSEHFRSRNAGQPVKSVALSLDQGAASLPPRSGEFLITAGGIEGSLVYALSAAIRDTIEVQGSALLHLDLLPGWSLDKLTSELSRPQGRDSLANHLRRRAGISGVKAGLVRECLSAAALAELVAPQDLAAQLKSLPLKLAAPRPLDEAISSAGGLVFDALDSQLMVKALPGVFCAGEMIDWEAPTGGYLLTACFASGRAAGLGAAAYLKG